MVYICSESRQPVVSARHTSDPRFCATEDVMYEARLQIVHLSSPVIVSQTLLHVEPSVKEYMVHTVIWLAGPQSSGTQASSVRPAYRGGYQAGTGKFPPGSMSESCLCCGDCNWPGLHHRREAVRWSVFLSQSCFASCIRNLLSCMVQVCTHELNIAHACEHFLTVL